MNNRGAPGGWYIISRSSAVISAGTRRRGSACRRHILPEANKQTPNGALRVGRIGWRKYAGRAPADASRRLMCRNDAKWRSFLAGAAAFCRSSVIRACHHRQCRVTAAGRHAMNASAASIIKMKFSCSNQLFIQPKWLGISQRAARAGGMSRMSRHESPAAASLSWRYRNAPIMPSIASSKLAITRNLSPRL